MLALASMFVLRTFNLGRGRKGGIMFIGSASCWLGGRAGETELIWARGMVSNTIFLWLSICLNWTNEDDAAFISASGAIYSGTNLIRNTNYDPNYLRQIMTV